MRRRQEDDTEKEVLADSLKTLKRVTTSFQRQEWNRLKSRYISNL